MSTADEIHAAAIEANKAGYLLAKLSDGLRLTFNGITVKRWPGFDVAPILDYIADERKQQALFLARKAPRGMQFVNHTERKLTRRQAAEQAAAHISGVIQRVGPTRAIWFLADTLPHWTEESYLKAAQPEQHANLIDHIEQRITIIQ